MSDRQLPLFPDPVPRAVETFVPSDHAARRFATDPRHNVVLEASAGTGKTTVLVQRYLNLLRAGVDPTHILAITFTRQAAAEMRGRIIAALRADAEESAVGRARWSELRDRLGEIGISTVDAFCLSLLREFPLEADLDPTFALADDTEVPRLTEEAVERALSLGGVLAHDDQSIAMLLARLGPHRSRRALTHLLQRRLVVPAVLSRFLASSPRGLTGETVCRDAAARLADRVAPLAVVVRQLAENGPDDDPVFALVARDLVAVSDLPARGEAAIRIGLDRLRTFFLTQKGTARKVFRAGGRLSPAAKRRFRESALTLAPLVHDVLRGFDRDVNVVMASAVQRLFAIAESEYRRGLDARALLDFSDVLQRAVNLLRNMDEFARSRYRLESRYHHVLVDEFQDTSRAQWELISLLVEAWGEGSGLVEEAPVSPTIFVVGDRKQSIYGFRDADVSVLREAGRAIARLRPDRDVHRSISHSFRAVRDLLGFVNDVFQEIGAAADGPDAFAYDVDDRFPIDRADASGDDTPRADHSSALGLVVGDDVEACAAGVAAEIQRILEAGRVRARGEVGLRDVRPGDIGILFRARETHREFERALVLRGIPTYVYKGLGFFDADETKDVRALVRFLANPASELRAAAFLRSRVAGVSDRTLVACAGRLSDLLVADTVPGGLDQAPDEDRRRVQLLREGVRRWLAWVDRRSPADIVDGILGETGYGYELRGPHVIQTRENVKKARALVRRLANRGYATMARVSDEIDHLSQDISTAVVEAQDAVNLMTVHAAKGLEFPIVFLVDLGRGTGPDSPSVWVVADRGDGEPAVAVWPYRLDPDATDGVDTRRIEQEETKRLLYVALTRARDRLYLSTTVRDGQPVLNRGSLGAVLPSSLASLLGQAALISDEAIAWSGPRHEHRLRVCRLGESDGAASDMGEPMVERVARGLEDGSLGRAVDLTPVVWSEIDRRTVTRRSSSAAWPEAAPGVGDSDRARIVGSLVHRLIEKRLWSTRAIDELIQEAHQMLLEERPSEDTEADSVARRAVMMFEQLRRHPRVRELEGKPCLFEVPFSYWERDRSIASHPVLTRGTIDCLVRTREDAVTVLEFKTGSPRDEHRQQLALYVAAVRSLMPRAHVDGHLVYPEKPHDQS